MEINEYQFQARQTKQTQYDQASYRTICFLGLAEGAGQLLSEYKKHIRDGDAYVPFQERVTEELGDLLWYVASVADEFGLSLEDIAAANLYKCKERWASGDLPPLPQFDHGFPDSEQFPRQQNITVVTIQDGERRKLRLLNSDGIPIGNDLTDNAYEEDGYRFHDVFHLTCMAMLGWSPVMRKLLDCKRDSNPGVREVEDGGRATVIEEGISALVFYYAEQHAHLRGVSSVDYELLRTIKGMTRNFEISKCPPQQWERAILTAYSLWRKLSSAESGCLLIDLDQRTIKLTD